ncbi:MAG: DegT/DnrJ/EryC1/StrS family aminotransferase [Magnetococcales bacterium]|nr:DegT/DnrJ/EryC1/StrS family aminotransferase [Magnetococcales bacterium]
MSPLPTNRPITIPLVRGDLTQEDQRALLQQAVTDPRKKNQPLERWEAAWQAVWQRPCVAFADPSELLTALKDLLGWASGLTLQTSPLLHPIWREAMEEAWLIPSGKNPIDNLGREDPLSSGETAPRWVQHLFGLPAAVDPQPSIVLEEVSSLIKPLASRVNSLVQLMVLDGNRMIQAGATALVFSQDGDLIEALRNIRKRPPAPAIAAFGLSQLKRLDDLITRRELLASRYLRLRDRQQFTPPPVPEGGRRWESYVIDLPSREKRQGLQFFLNKAGIGAAPPLWYHVAKPQTNDAQAQALAHLQENALALPLYAHLSDRDQKRIINRVHRWVERGGPLRE